MKVLGDLVPVILFFLAYRPLGIFAATGILVAATLVQLAVGWIRHRRVEGLQVATAALVLVFGGLTLALKDPVFIKLKPTIVNGLFALVFLGSGLFGRAPMVEILLGNALKMPDRHWNRLNLAWVFFFIASGILNLVVAFRFEEATWVTFKLFGLTGMTFVFLIAQLVFLRSWLVEDGPESEPADPPAGD